MIIDWHAHVYPPELAKERYWGNTTPLTIENLLEAHEKAGIDLCVVSNTIHYLKEKTNQESLAFLQRWNEYGAGIQQKYKDRIIVFTSTLPCGGAPFVKELERAIVEHGLKGVLINSSHQRAYPDDDEAKPFFELVTSLGIPVMMHAPSVGFGEERMRDYRLASSVGRPFDECLSIARLIVRGVFERFPKLKFVGCHLGGGICDVIGRMDYAYELADLASGLGSYEPMLITKCPSEYLKALYMDTVAYHPPAVMCAYQTVGAKHLLFGSDAPPLLPLLPRARKIIEELPITAAERDDIFANNALKLIQRG
ncbi:MAG TPA: amidohydrolase family protein [Candidatus Binatia bacterium]|jgi:aminocarboxymuconate-semialdehyde decarboxylase|nr:amidohydrolase family protein [Candidatus Binatia bacterium]